MAAPPSPDALAQAALHLRAGEYFQIAAYVMLIYDHMLTFSTEVDRIWRQRFSGASFLFLINRYVTPLQFIIIIDAFQDRRWTKRKFTVTPYTPQLFGFQLMKLSCSRFVSFEGASTIALIAVCEAMMILRVYALYGRSSWILGFLGFLWIAQIVLSSIGISTGFAVPLPPGFVGCILTGTSPLFPAVWVMPLITDTFIFGFTMWRTVTHFRNSASAPTLRLFMRDGFLYFFVIFSANLLNMLIYFLAPSQDLRAIGASFSQLITSVMVSRLVLNLRSLRYDDNANEAQPITLTGFAARTVQHLGEGLDTTSSDMPLRGMPRKGS